jgi:hypothetical protein
MTDVFDWVTNPLILVDKDGIGVGVVNDSVDLGVVVDIVGTVVDIVGTVVVIVVKFEHNSLFSFEASVQFMIWNWEIALKKPNFFKTEFTSLFVDALKKRLLTRKSTCFDVLFSSFYVTLSDCAPNYRGFAKVVHVLSSVV